MIPGSEIAELFRRVIAGTATIIPDDCSWEWVWAGNFSCTIDGYKLTIFNDCGELDYVDYAVAPDGRECDFNTWYDQNDEPVSLLSMEEVCRMEAALETCGGREK